MDKSVDALFGSKTRVKLLSLFFNNPDDKFYVREISRVIDEQVNSVRRELANLQQANIVKSSTQDRKLFYYVNQRFKYYLALRSIFAGISLSTDSQVNVDHKWLDRVKPIKENIGLFVISGVLVDGSESNLDMLIVGDNANGKLSAWADGVEKQESRRLDYSILSMSDFYYRYRSGDTFLQDIFKNKNQIIIDRDKLIK